MNPQPRAALSDLALERAVLGALIAHGEAWARVAGTLRPEHFTDPAAGGLFKVIRSVAERDGRINAMSVRTALEVDENGGNAWRDSAIMALFDAAPVSADEIDGLASSLVEVWARRHTTQVGEWLTKEAQRAYASPFDQAREAAQYLEEVISTGRSAESTRACVGDIASDCLDDLDNDAPSGATTGLTDLDKYLGGYVPGRLIIEAGRPGMGKSSTASSSARQTAKAGGGVFYASLEMTKKELTARMLTDLAWSRETPISYEKVLNKRLEPHEKARLQSVLPRLQELPLIIDDQSGLTVEELQARARRVAQDMARRGGKLSLVVVDHLQLLKQDVHLLNNQTRAIGEISRRLKLMAKELNVCVLALCQLNRGVEGRDDKRPTKADLRQSGEIEENADQILLLYREAYYLAKRQEDDGEAEQARQAKLDRVSHELEIIIDKNRHGEETTVRAWADMGSCAVRNASYGAWQ